MKTNRRARKGAAQSHVAPSTPNDVYPYPSSWVESLGKLPGLQKMEFCLRAVAVLHRAARAGEPSKDETASLHEVAERAEALQRALDRASRLDLPARYIRNAWVECQRDLAASDEDAPACYPQNLRASLTILAAAARRWAPQQQKEAHRQKDWSSRTMAGIQLAAVYREVFGVAPSRGPNSVFLKFCRTAFESYGFKPPSSDLVERWVRLPP